MTHDLLAQAATELHHAADIADTQVDGDPFSPWAALAAQIRLVAAQAGQVIPATPLALEEPSTHLARADRLARSIPRAQAPPDLADLQANIAVLLRQEAGVTGRRHPSGGTAGSDRSGAPS